MSKKLMLKELRVLLWTVFILYLVVLVYVIILKEGSAIDVAKFRYSNPIPLWQRVAGINFIPLKTIIYYLGGKPSVNIAIQNLSGNTLAFCPLGFLLPLLFRKCNNSKKIFFISAGISFFIELIQEIFYLGSGDIDDLTLNVLGSLLGFAVYCLLKWLTKSKVEIAS